MVRREVDIHISYDEEDPSDFTWGMDFVPKGNEDEADEVAKVVRHIFDGYGVKRRIGFDLHGVLTESPRIFRQILSVFRGLGYEIHVISGPSEDEIRGELGGMGYIDGLHYDKVFSMVDYLKTRVEMWSEWNDDQKRVSWWCKDEDWWPVKGIYCESEGIDILFDDKDVYAKFMPLRTLFVLCPER